jgi:hypothetical protein
VVPGFSLAHFRVNHRSTIPSLHFKCLQAQPFQFPALRGIQDRDVLSRESVAGSEIEQEIEPRRRQISGKLSRRSRENLLLANRLANRQSELLEFCLTPLCSTANSGKWRSNRHYIAHSQRPRCRAFWVAQPLTAVCIPSNWCDIAPSEPTVPPNPISMDNLNHRGKAPRFALLAPYRLE